MATPGQRIRSRIVLFIILVSSVPVGAATWYVSQEGSPAGDGTSWATALNTIQAGIDAASEGDTIEIADGIYTGEGNRDISFQGKAITVRSQNGPAKCIINCQGAKGDNHRGFLFESGETTASILEGLTVFNGYHLTGGAIYANGSSPAITDCVLSDNQSSGPGGAISCESSSSPQIANCVMVANQADTGGAIYCFNDSNPTFTNCTIATNNCSWKGSALNCCYNSRPEITNCIIWANHGGDDSAISFDTNALPLIRYSNIQGGWQGKGNISADPRFSMDGADLHLLADSPCIDTGSPVLITTDIDNSQRTTGVSTDMGAYEYDSSESPALALSTTSIRIIAHTGSEAPETAHVELRNRASGTLKWSATTNADWLSLEPSFGLSTGDTETISISTNPSRLDAGHHGATINIIDPATSTPLGVIHIDLFKGTERIVNAEGTAEYPTIQAAIDASVDGDQITCLPGTYSGTGNRDISFNGKTITLLGLQGPKRTIIDCTSYDDIDHSGFFFTNGETADATLDGFTVTGVTGVGSAIHCEQSSPTITNCIIRENNIRNAGSVRPGSNPKSGVLYFNGASPSVTNTIITKNQTLNGGGITSVGSATPSITNCVIYDNEALEYGGGLYNDNSDPTLTNCILRNNTPNEIFNAYSNPVVTWCNVQGGTSLLWFGTGCIDEEPLFVYPDCYYLEHTSPCIDTGTNGPAGGLPAVDMDGKSRPVDGDGDTVSTADMGVFEHDPVNPVIALKVPGISFYSSIAGSNPPDQTVSLRNVGGGTLNWQASCDASWITCTPASDNSSGQENTITISVNTTGLQVGRHIATLTIADSQAANTPQWLTVTLFIGRTIRVPDDYPTIQEAIDAAISPVDVVEIANGTWTGPGNKNLDFKGKAITVRSESGNPHSCIIDCEKEGRGFYFHTEEGPDSVVEGLSVAHGYLDLENTEEVFGGGIYCKGASPTIRNCIFKENRILCSEWNSSGYTSGGAIHCTESNSHIINCLFDGNIAGGQYTDGGGGFACASSNPRVENCIFRGNFAYKGGSIYNNNSTLTLSSCVFENNENGDSEIMNDDSHADIQNSIFRRGGQYYWYTINNYSSTCNITQCTFTDLRRAVRNYGSSPVITNCIIRNSRAPGTIYNKNDSNPVITNCIIWGGSSPHIENINSNPIITYSNIQNGTGETWFGTGCIDSDPMFASDDSNYILPQSPCIDAGTNTPQGGLPTPDLDGNPRPLDGNDDGSEIADMGLYEVMTAHSVISLTPRSIEFFTHTKKGNPPSQTMTFRNAGDIPSNWQITGQPSWLHVSPSSGTASAEPVEITLDVEIEDLPGGLHKAELIVSDSQASNSPQTIPITLYLASSIRVPADHPTIQNAMDAAFIPGDTVELADGVWTGPGNKNLHFRGKPITVQSESGKPELCIIDCQGDGRGFILVNNEGADSMIDGLTIQNGYVDSEDCVSPSGAGIYSESADPTITNCRFVNNEAEWYGGGIYADFSYSSIKNCSFIANKAAGGGGACYTYCTNSMSNCYFINNEATVSGGGVYYRFQDYYGDWITIQNCLFSNNHAGTNAGAIAFRGLNRSYLSISNCTFSGNSAGESGGCIFNEYRVSMKLSNCILADNSPDNIQNYNDDATVSATYSTIQNGSSEPWFGTGCIDQSPLFIDSDGPDDNPATWEDNDFRLTASSPCIDAGNNAAISTDPDDLDGDGITEEPLPFDLDGNLRFIDDPRIADTGAGTPPIVDMGVYEYQAPLLGDIDLDGDVDLDDFTLFAACLTGPEVTTPPTGIDPATVIQADLDADSDVDLADFALFQQQFEATE